MRVYELAKRLKIPSKELVEKLRELGEEVTSHSSSIDDETAQAVIDLVTRPQEVVEEEIVEEAPKEEEPRPPLKTISITDPITLSELAAKLEIKPTLLIQELMKEGLMYSINQRIDGELATKIIRDHGFEAHLIPLYEEEKIEEEEEDREEDLLPRPPVVTIMGHVDHGKTKLLDAIRKSNIVEGEAGGITQHIGAYKVKVGKGEVVFLDTPGHEAFTSMRARGAKITDVVVLVVAADDGVMPQTKEAINHARAAGVPIVVAINKIDLPQANPSRVKQQLSGLDLVPEDLGGKTLLVEVSAKEGLNLDELLESLLLEAEMLELRANPHRKAQGTVIEARLDRTRGPVATFLVQQGTLRKGDPFVVGLHYGKVRALFDDLGREIKEAGPSTPVEILGLSGVPEAGDTFQVVTSEKRAKEISLRRQEIKREAQPTPTRITLDRLSKEIKEGKIKELNVIIKADVQGSVEVLRDSLEKLSTEEVRVKVIHGGVGGINESDVMLAAASNAIIIGFHVRPDGRVREVAAREGVDIRPYQIIYEVTDDVRRAMEGLLSPKIEEEIIGVAEVRKTFRISKVGTVAGCYVKEGKVRDGENVRVIRDGVVVFEGKIKSLKRFKDSVQEVASGLECGIAIENFNDIKIDDLIEVFRITETPKTL
jgi:translation initiation factor IF-2